MLAVKLRCWWIIGSMDEGFILANKYRRAVFTEIAAGESNPRMIAKKHHIIDKVVDDIVSKLIDGGLVEEKNDAYVLTGEGEKIAAELQNQEKM